MEGGRQHCTHFAIRCAVENQGVPGEGRKLEVDVLDKVNEGQNTYKTIWFGTVTFGLRGTPSLA